MTIQSILMTADTVGGVWTYALELIQALGEYDIKVTLATMGAPVTLQQRFTAAKIENLEIVEGRNEFGNSFKLEWMENPWDDVKKSGEWLLELEAKVKPDIVHLNGYSHGSLRWKSPVLMVGHSCVLSWWEAVKGESAPASWDYYRQAVLKGLQGADLVVAPTEAMLGALEQHYGKLQNRRVIPNGCKVERFLIQSSSLMPLTPNPSPRGRGENKGGTREKVPLFKGDLGGSFLQLDGEKNKFKKEAFVFAAGRVWDEAKNIGMLERIASQLLCPVYVAGNAKEPQKEEVNLKHNKRSPLTPLNKGGTRNPFKGDLGGSFPTREGGEICFLGRLSGEEMREWYRRAAVYALPAKYEPFGLSVLEAALSGCALVLGDIPSLRENWDGVAVFVSPEDAEGLVRAINDLIENQEKRWELARKCYDRALFFTSQRMAKGYINAYSALIND